jgi:hypothetical protein
MRKIKSFKQFNEAIGFKIPGDNRDEPRSKSKRVGYKSYDEIKDRILSLMYKLREMADRGEEYEKQVAMNKLIEIGKKYGISVNNLGNKPRGLGYRPSYTTVEDINKEIREIEESN